MTVKGAEKAGERLSEAILQALPVGTELDEREQALLDAAAKQADALEVLEADIRDRGHVLENGAVNPSTKEARVGRLAMARLLAGIDLPDSKSFTQLRARKAAEVRWGTNGRKAS